jgi:hypothetical protein
MPHKCQLRLVDLAIKYNDKVCEACCAVCGTWMDIEVKWVVTLRDSPEYVCEDCVDDSASELLAACTMANEN